MLLYKNWRKSFSENFKIQQNLCDIDDKNDFVEF